MIKTLVKASCYSLKAHLAILIYYNHKDLLKVFKFFPSEVYQDRSKLIPNNSFTSKPHGFHNRMVTIIYFIPLLRYSQAYHQQIRIKNKINKWINTLFNVNCDGSGCPFFLEGAKLRSWKTGVPGEKRRRDIEIDKSQPTCGAQDFIPGRRGERRN